MTISLLLLASSGRSSAAHALFIYSAGLLLACLFDDKILFFVPHGIKGGKLEWKIQLLKLSMASVWTYFVRILKLDNIFNFCFVSLSNGYIDNKPYILIRSLVVDTTGVFPSSIQSLRNFRSATARRGRL